MSSSRDKSTRSPSKESDVKPKRRRDKNRTVVSIPNRVHQRLWEALDQVSHHGWSAFGIDRHDPASLGAIIDEGINQLLERIKRAKASRDATESGSSDPTARTTTNRTA